MAASSNWHVITGAPSSGKTSIIEELAKRGYCTVEEMGRKLIDQKLARGNSLEEIKVDSPGFEEEWVKMQLKTETRLDKSELLFLDRGIVDTLAYFRFYGWPVSGTINEALAKASYGKVFLLELFQYENDYARVEKADAAQKMQGLFRDVYKETGHEVIFVPKGSISERIDLILGHISL